MRSKTLNYVHLYGCFLIYSLTLVFSKLASQQADIAAACVYFFCEIVILGVYAVLWQQILKKFPLVVAMSHKGITIIFSLIWAILIFHEDITMYNLIGALLIVAGIGLVSWDD